MRFNLNICRNLIPALFLVYMGNSCDSLEHRTKETKPLETNVTQKAYLEGKFYFLQLPMEGKESDVLFRLRPLADFDTLDVMLTTDYMNIEIVNSEIDYMTSAGYIQRLYFSNGHVNADSTQEYNFKLKFNGQGSSSLKAIVHGIKNPGGETIEQEFDKKLDISPYRKM